MAGDAPIRVADDDRPGWARLILTGRVTVHDAGPFHTTARELLERGANVAVQCEAAEYLDTSALQILLCLGRGLVTRGRQFDIGGVSGALAECFRLAGVSKASRS